MGAEDYLRVLSHNIETGADAFHGFGQVIRLTVAQRAAVARSAARAMAVLSEKRRDGMVQAIERQVGFAIRGLGYTPDKFTAAQLQLVADKANMGVWELERLSDHVIESNLEMINSTGRAAIRYDEKIPTPSQAGIAAFKESISTDLSNIGKTAADAARSAAGGFAKIAKYLPYIVLGGVGLIGLTYLAPVLKRKRA